MMDRWTPQMIVFFFLVFFGLVYLLSPILTPFLVSAFLAYLAQPLVKRLVHWHIPQTLSAAIIFISLFTFIIALIFLLLPVVEKQFITFIEFTPRMLEWIRLSLVNLMAYFNIHEINVDILKQTVSKNIGSANTIAAWLGKTALSSTLTIVAFITNLILIPVVTFYLLRDWNTLLNNIKELLPRKIEPTVVHLTKQCDLVLGQFIRGQLLVMLALGIIYSIGLSLIGLNVGIIIGMISGLAAIVPYLGFIVGILSASIAAFLQFNTWSAVVFVLLVYMVGQAIESTLLTPLLIGNRIGLHPVAVIFAILAGGTLFGFLGVLLALPVASILMVLIRYAAKKYQGSGLYKAR